MPFPIFHVEWAGLVTVVTNELAESMEESVTLVPLHSNQVAEVSAEARSAKRKAGESSTSAGVKWYKQKFRDSWLLDDRFKNWLVCVPEDPYRAKCKLCNADLRAGKSELEKHAKTKHHRDTVKAVEDVKALLGFANQAEAQTLPDMPADLPSADQSDNSFQVQEEELSRPIPTATLASVPPRRRTPPVPGEHFQAVYLVYPLFQDWSGL